MTTVRELLQTAQTQLSGSDTARLDAEVLLIHASGLSRARLYADPDFVPEVRRCDTFLELLTMRAAGTPVAYLTGKREFWSLDLTVTPDVLIPRPETELLVETALSFIPDNEPCRIADLGTGSGAVALAIASERPACEVHATEISCPALEVARANGDALLPGRVQFHQGSWLDPLEGKFDLVVSNPPYIDANDEHLDRGDVRFEPRSALTPGFDDLKAIDEIARQARDYLVPGGLLAFEHGFEQALQVRQLLESLKYKNVETRKDFAGCERVTVGYFRTPDTKTDRLPVDLLV